MSKLTNEAKTVCCVQYGKWLTPSSHLCPNKHRDNFTQCVHLLAQVSAATAASDPKIVHNMSVAQFYATEQRQYTVFQESIDKLLPQIKEAQQQSTSASHASDNEFGSAAGPTDAQFNITDMTLSHAHFNRAVVLFHLRQPKAALRILSALQPHMSEMGSFFKEFVCS